MAEQEIPDLIQLYDQGVLTRHELQARIFALMGSRSPQAVVESIPDALRKEFVLWARTNYGGDAPAESYLAIKDPSPPSDARKAIENFRLWLHERGGTSRCERRKDSE